jgi:hypothetical protein
VTDATGLATLQTTYLQGGATAYVQVQAQGQIIDNSWKVTLGTQSSGNFTLTYGGQTTANIAYNAASSAVQSALQALSGIGTNATVSGSAGGPYTVTFSGALATSTNALTVTFSGLSTPGNASIASQVVYNTFTHQMACKANKPSAFKDVDGLFIVPWELNIIEDPNWNSGQAQTLTVTNLLTGL